jgi:membrane protease YdiL (CAAX protease family)
MAVLGPDFRAGLRHPLYRPYGPINLSPAIGIFAVLLIANQVIFQPLFAAGIAAFGAGDADDFFAGLERGTLLSILPAGLLTAYFAWILARQRGKSPKEVLALHYPAMGIVGWSAIILGFPVTMFIVFYVLALVFRFDLTSTGLVEQTVMQSSNDPLYFLIAGGLIIGAPIAEELTFRGQIFAALSQTRLGVFGTSVITSALWAALHGFAQPPLYVIVLLFVMGMALCWLLVRFGSLWVTIACHATWNAVQTILLYFPAQP